MKTSHRQQAETILEIVKNVLKLDDSDLYYKIEVSEDLFFIRLSSKEQFLDISFNFDELQKELNANITKFEALTTLQKTYMWLYFKRND